MEATLNIAEGIDPESVINEVVRIIGRSNLLQKEPPILINLKNGDRLKIQAIKGVIGLELA